MMRKQEGLEGNFNTKADEGSSSDRESRRQRTRGKVVDYVDADPELKAYMDKLMEPIDNSPDSFEAIIRPDGWTIPDEVAAIHGIASEMAIILIIYEAEALEGFIAIHERVAQMRLPRRGHSEPVTSRRGLLHL